MSSNTYYALTTRHEVCIAEKTNKVTLCIILDCDYVAPSSLKSPHSLCWISFSDFLLIAVDIHKDILLVSLFLPVLKCRGQVRVNKPSPSLLSIFSWFLSRWPQVSSTLHLDYNLGSVPFLVSQSFLPLILWQKTSDMLVRLENISQVSMNGQMGQWHTYDLYNYKSHFHTRCQDVLLMCRSGRELEQKFPQHARSSCLFNWTTMLVYLFTVFIKKKKIELKNIKSAKLNLHTYKSDLILNCII